MVTRGSNTELKVGIFTVAGLGALAVIAVTLEGNPFAQKKQAFYTLLENVGGVGARTQVRTSGVQVGEVTSIEIMPLGAKVHFRVDGTVKIPTGSYIELRSRGILGDVFIEIVRNENGKESIPTGSLIEKRKEMNDFNALMESVGSIAKDLQTVSRSLAQVLGNEDGKSSMKNILTNIEQITTDTRDFISTERKNAAAAIQGIRDTVAKLNNIIDRNDGKIDETIRSVADVTRDLKVFSSELRKIVSGPNKEHIKNILASTDETVQNIQKTSAKIQLIVDKVEKGEGTLGQLVSKDDTANELKATLKNVQELLRPATQLKIEVDYKGELRSEDAANLGQTGNHFNLRMSTRPDRFYLIGVSDSPSTHKVTTISRTRSSDGAVETVREDERSPEDRNRLRFNAQFAKRFQVVGVRFGLFESYAGIAGDLYFFNDRLAASIEAFNFGSTARNAERGDSRGFARIKSYANFFITPNIYLTGGADNIGKEPRPFGFLGAGLRFSDDDIKSLFGAAALAK
jgi:phospholipid/cholesterol/gamma-HCH transport system substrate-binding protein